MRPLASRSNNVDFPALSKPIIKSLAFDFQPRIKPIMVREVPTPITSEMNEKHCQCQVIIMSVWKPSWK